MTFTNQGHNYEQTARALINSANILCPCGLLIGLYKIALYIISDIH